MSPSLASGIWRRKHNQKKTVSHVLTHVVRCSLSMFRNYNMVNTLNLAQLYRVLYFIYSSKTTLRLAYKTDPALLFASC